VFYFKEAASRRNYQEKLKGGKEAATRRRRVERESRAVEKHESNPKEDATKYLPYHREAATRGNDFLL